MSAPGEMRNEEPQPIAVQQAAITRARRAKVLSSLFAEPSHSWAGVALAGVVWLLVALQVLTGALLAFYYVPSSESAHASVAYMEKVAAGGSWIRAMHTHASLWLPVALLLQLGGMLWRASYRRRPLAWAVCVALLALSLAAGALGYSLPWDARAFYSTQIAAAMTGDLPFVGGAAKDWLLGGERISPLTLPRFYALHVLLLPFLILLAVASRFFVSYFREISQRIGAPSSTAHAYSLGTATNEVDSSTGKNDVHAQLAIASTAVLIVFAALAFVAASFPAPLGPPPAAMSPAYLPRPGLQFLWLFQLLKYLSGATASLAALLFPGLLLAVLASLPYFDSASRPRRTLRRAATSLFITLCALVLGLTALARLADRRDPAVYDQLTRQAIDEAEFRRAPFIPRRVQSGSESADTNDGTRDTPSSSDSIADRRLLPPPPASYAEHCARCHGARGEGRSINPRLIGVATQPRRSVADIIALLDDPASYGLESRMPSFAGKLTDEEKRQLALWIVSLK